MYILTTLSDLVQIAPEDFEKHSLQAITDNINSKFADKVIPRVGLCIGLNDILHCSDGLIGHGTGIVNVNVKFRVRIFRPSKGEILEGIISGSSPSGITIHMEFFDDIFVPGPISLFEGTTFNNAEQVWVWKTDDGSELYFDTNEVVRFRVEAETWQDQSPQHALSDEAAQHIERKSPYSIIGSMQQAGLGVVIWW